MECPSPTAYRSALDERLLDLLAAMRKLCGKKHLTTFIVHNGDPGGPAPRIEFDAQRLYLRLATHHRVPKFALNVASKLAKSGQVSLPKQAHPLLGDWVPDVCGISRNP